MSASPLALTAGGGITVSGSITAGNVTATVAASASGATVTGRNDTAGEGATVSIESAGDVTLTQETGELSGLSVKAKGTVTVKSPVAVRGWMAGDTVPALAIDDADAAALARMLTFATGIGTLFGHHGTLRHLGLVGDVLVMPTPDYPDEFLYWEGSRYYPGDAYVIADDHSSRTVYRGAGSHGDDGLPGAEEAVGFGAGSGTAFPQAGGSVRTASLGGTTGGGWQGTGASASVLPATGDVAPRGLPALALAACGATLRRRRAA